MTNKKFYHIVFLALISLLMLAGCGNNDNSPAIEAPPPTNTPDPPVLNDTLGIGDIAPDFTLPDSDGNLVNLANVLGENEFVVLVFYYSHF